MQDSDSDSGYDARHSHRRGDDSRDDDTDADENEAIQVRQENLTNLRALCLQDWANLSQEDRDFKSTLKLNVYDLFGKYNISDYEILNSVFNRKYTAYTLRKLSAPVVAPTRALAPRVSLLNAADSSAILDQLYPPALTIDTQVRNTYHPPKGYDSDAENAQNIAEAPPIVRFKTSPVAPDPKPDKIKIKRPRAKKAP